MTSFTEPAAGICVGIYGFGFAPAEPRTVPESLNSIHHPPIWPRV
jgi:hypothetical protein